MKAFWNLFSIAAVIFTYYAAWQHEPFWMIIGFIPQLITLGYNLKR